MPAGDLNSVYVAAPTIDNPHTLIFSIAAVVFMLLPMITVGTERDLSWQRRVYWGGTLGAVICAFTALLPSLTAGLSLALLALFIATVRAYFSTQYIKLGRRVIAFHSATDLRAANRIRPHGLRQDEPYGSTVSAAKLWWLLVVCTTIAAVNLYGYLFDGDELGYGLLGLGLLVGIGALIGCGDGMRRQRVARGQYVPFGIVALVSAGIVTVSYLAAYSIATRFQKLPK